MIFEFLQKQKKRKEKIKLAKIGFLNMQIPEKEKVLYIQALEVLDEEWIDRIYDIIVNFVKTVEIKELEDIQKNSFSVISGLKRKEAEEKKEEINAFSFLINNI